MNRITPPPTPERLSVTVKEAAGMLGVGRSLIFRLLAEGQLKGLLVGNRRLIPVHELKAFLQRECAFKGSK